MLHVSVSVGTLDSTGDLIFCDVEREMHLGVRYRTCIHTGREHTQHFLDSRHLTHYPRRGRPPSPSLGSQGSRDSRKSHEIMIALCSRRFRIQKMHAVSMPGASASSSTVVMQDRARKSPWSSYVPSKQQRCDSEDAAQRFAMLWLGW